MLRAWHRYFCLIALLGWLSAIGPPWAWAATNSITAGVGGINNGTLSGGDGTGTGQISLTIVNLALVKQARDIGGNVLPNGTSVPSGQVLYFVLYVDNVTAMTAGDIRITDLLDESQFTYLPNSIETTLVPSGSSNAAIWAGIWTALSDGVDGDMASITDSAAPAGPDRVTIGAVSGQANSTLNIPASSLRAIRFRVTVN